MSVAAIFANLIQMVIDIAESGVRILIGRHERLKKRAKCHIDLLCGDVLNIKAVLVRRDGDEAALAFKPPVEYRVLLKEKQAAKEGMNVEHRTPNIEH